MPLILVSKKEFNFFSFFSCGKFVNISMEPFYQSFSCTLVFSALSWRFISPWLYELFGIYRNSFQVNCLSLNNCIIFKKWRLWVISAKKKICQVISYQPIMENKLQGNKINSYFYISPNNQKFHEPSWVSWGFMSVIFWKDFVFALKVGHGKCIK